MKDIDSRLIGVFRAVFIELETQSDELIKTTSKANLYSWDSGGHLMLITCLEEEFEISISNELVITIDTFQMAKFAVMPD